MSEIAIAGFTIEQVRDGGFLVAEAPRAGWRDAWPSHVFAGSLVECLRYVENRFCPPQTVAPRDRGGASPFPPRLS